MLSFGKFKKAYCRLGNTENKALQKYNLALSRFGMDEQQERKKRRTAKFYVNDRVIHNDKVGKIIAVNDNLYDVLFDEYNGIGKLIPEEELKTYNGFPQDPTKVSILGGGVMAKIVYKKFSDILTLLSGVIHEIETNSEINKYNNFSFTFSTNLFMRINLGSSQLHTVQDYINIIKNSGLATTNESNENALLYVSHKERPGKERMEIPVLIREDTVTHIIPGNILNEVKDLLSVFVGRLSDRGNVAGTFHISISFLTNFYDVNEELNTKYKLTCMKGEEEEFDENNGHIDIYLKFKNHQVFHFRPEITNGSNVIRYSMSRVDNNSQTDDEQTTIPSTTNMSQRMTNPVLRAVTESLPFSLGPQIENL